MAFDVIPGSTICLIQYQMGVRYLLNFKHVFKRRIAISRIVKHYFFTNFQFMPRTLDFEAAT